MRCCSKLPLEAPWYIAVCLWLVLPVLLMISQQYQSTCNGCESTHMSTLPTSTKPHRSSSSRLLHRRIPQLTTNRSCAGRWSVLDGQTCVAVQKTKGGARCAEPRTFIAARKRCHKLRARLCSVSELQFATPGSGCDHNLTAWSNTACDSIGGGETYWVVAASTSRPRCESIRERHRIVCCLDLTR